MFTVPADIRGDFEHYQMIKKLWKWLKYLNGYPNDIIIIVKGARLWRKGENHIKVFEYQLNTTKAKLEVLGIVTENLEIKE